MGDDVASFVGLVPLLILLILMFYVVRRSRRNTAEIMRVNEEIIALNKDMVESLRNIENLLKDRKP